MSVRKFGRRHFLVGAGGFTLATPFLSSLVQPSAAGQPPRPPKRFVCITTDHGGVWPLNMFPDSMQYEARVRIPGAHDMRHAPLQADVDSGMRRLSPVLSAPDYLFPESLLPKLNLLSGIDFPQVMQHHTGGFLGNFARRDFETGADRPHYLQTIDQLMAKSGRVYESLDGIREPSLTIGASPGERQISWNQTSGGVTRVQPERDPLTLFNRIFDPGASPVDTGRTPVIDRVLAQYRDLRSGAFGDARRLSRVDRERLDAYVSHLDDLQRKLAVIPKACEEAHAPPQKDPGFLGNIIAQNAIDLIGLEEYYALINGVIATAFLCDSTRVVTMQVSSPFTNVHGAQNWHQEVAHKSWNHIDPTAQNRLVEGQRSSFEHVFLDLVNRLDVPEDEGRTHLDNSLVMWVQESGTVTHSRDSVPIVTAGSAGGFLRTGQHLDYRNHDYAGAFNTGGDIDDPAAAGANRQLPGLLYNQWLATVLQAMDVPPAEFEVDGKPGYGRHYDLSEAHPQRIWEMASEVLPQIRNDS